MVRMMLMAIPSLTIVVNDITFLLGLKRIRAVIRGRRPRIKKPLDLV